MAGLTIRLYMAFFKIGLLGFGGGMAIIQLIYDSIRPFTEMSREQFANIVAIAQVTPGPIAVNAATYVGYETAGFFGSFFATLGVVTPAFILVAIVCRMVTRYKESTIVKGALEGIRPATAGLIAAAVVTLGEPVVFAKQTLGSTGSGLIPFSIPSFIAGVDPVALLLALITAVLLLTKKANPFSLLIVIGCIGAVLGV